MSTESSADETGNEQSIEQPNEAFPTEAVRFGGLNSVRRIGDQIERQSGPQSATVHRYLQHLRDEGFDGAPEPISLAGPIETLSFVEGEVTATPVTMSFRTDEAMTTAAALLRAMHDASENFEHHDDDVWDLPTREPVEVICHGDFAPYNCALNLGVVSGVFDFETAHPGTRLWDLGYAAYRWVPLSAPANPDYFGNVNENWRRLRLFVDAYFDEGEGSDDPNQPANAAPVYRGVIQAAIDRLTEHIDFMRARAAEGHEGFASHIEAGHDTLYLADIEHLRFLLR